MTLRLAFVVSGKPVPKARARQGKGGIWYTPSQTVHYERHIKWTAIEALQQRKVDREPPWPVDARYRVEVLIFFPDARRRDADNVFKSAADALNPRRASSLRPAGKPFVWKDDVQIVEHSVKVMGIDKLNPRIEVVIEVLQRRRAHDDETTTEARSTGVPACDDRWQDANGGRVGSPERRRVRDADSRTAPHGLESADRGVRSTGADATRGGCAMLNETAGGACNTPARHTGGYPVHSPEVITPTPNGHMLAIARAMLALPVPRKKLYRHDGQSVRLHLARRIGNGAVLVSQTGCWMWIRTKDSGGYANMTIDGRATHVSRVGWEVFFGEPPGGMDICHHCDEPACVFPEHWFRGTRSDNMKDCFQKGRGRAPGCGLPPVAFLGAENASARLTDVAVLDARERYAAGGIEMKDLAAELGVSDSTVNMFVRGRTWKHVGGPIAIGDQRNKTSHTRPRA